MTNTEANRGGAADEQTTLLSITLEGPGIRPGRISLGALATIAESIQKAAERIELVLRDGTSEHRGPIRRDVRERLELELAGIGEGSVVLDIEPTREALAAFAVTPPAIEKLIEGLAMLSDVNVLEQPVRFEAPDGFDYGVAQALKPLASIYSQYGVDRMVIERPAHAGRDAFQVRLRERNWAPLSQIEPAPKPVSRTLVGRLMMADLKNHKCRIYDTHGTSHLLEFDEEMSGGVHRALRGWVEAQLTEGDSTDAITGLALLTDDEVDELAPPRTTRWPRSIVRTYRAAAARAHEDLSQRPPLPRYELGD